MPSPSSPFMTVWRSTPEGLHLGDLSFTVKSHLLDLYIFADAHSTRHLRNDVMSAVAYLDYIRETWPGFRLTAKAYTNLPENSTWCKYLVKMCALYWNPDDDDGEERELADELPGGFLIEVLAINTRRANFLENSGEMEALRACGVDNVFPLEDLCTFHEHGTREEVEKCKEEGLRTNVFVQNLLAACVKSAESEQADETEVVDEGGDEGDEGSEGSETIVGSESRGSNTAASDKHMPATDVLTG
ncbi:hypothetical protein BU23DRAFT_96479 [Bimuria novae-zelandiae CBS 107.79]|uniref:Uncharacterized protein n=1 Tax=Bimuria novae-zelandiae CBS 107.79 TaxID=1447943 RepID=A0A6A5VCS7_9PLEO|nr:hypothetical protein BU23DRAFT_96479 [Bimuria novae-zelandiae CBS 107.79]